MNAFEQRQINDQATLARALAGGAMAAAANRARQIMLSCETNRRAYVGGADTARDQYRSEVVPHGIPDGAGLLVAGVRLLQQRALEIPLQLAEFVLPIHGVTAEF